MTTNATNATNKRNTTNNNNNNNTNNTNNTNNNNTDLQAEFEKAFLLYSQKEYTIEYSDKDFTKPVRLNLNKSIRKELRDKKQLDLKKLAYITYDKGAHLLFDIVKRELDTLNYTARGKQANADEEE